MPNHVTSVSLPVELLRRLTEQARREDRPQSWLVRDALTLYLSRATVMHSEELTPLGESSDLAFDPELSLRLDQITILIEAETNDFWGCVLTFYRTFLEKGIRNGG